MALDKDLIQILRCPRCKGELELEEDESGFLCHACKLRYAVENDIPNFLIEEAEKLE